MTGRPLSNIANTIAAHGNNCDLCDKTGTVSSRNVGSPVLDIDYQGRDSYLRASGYAENIYSYYKTIEDVFCTQPYMDSQSDIDEMLRAILIDWVVQVHLKFRLEQETLFLAVQIIDRYLAIEQITKKNLKLVGVTAMLIASKYVEIVAPEVRGFVYISDNDYSSREILDMEKTVLWKLDFELASPTSHHFLAHYLKACAAVDKHATEKRFDMFCMYGVEVSLSEYSMMGCPFSKISAASVLLARQTLGTGPWTITLEKYTGYKVSELQELADNIRDLMIEAACPTTTLKAVHTKYRSARFSCVAQLVA